MSEDVRTWRSSLPRERSLWAAVAALTMVACVGGAFYGASGERWRLGDRLTSSMPRDVARPSAWDLPPAGNLRVILKHNGVLFASLVFGLATAGVWTLGTYLLGVGIIGYTIGLASKVPLPDRTRMVLAMVAPHGVLEVLSFALVAVVGMRAFCIGCGYLRSGDVSLRKGEPSVWVARLAMGLALMVGAAVVEAYVTPKVIQGELERQFEAQVRK